MNRTKSYSIFLAAAAFVLATGVSTRAFAEVQDWAAWHATIKPFGYAGVGNAQYTGALRDFILAGLAEKPPNNFTQAQIDGVCKNFDRRKQTYGDPGVRNALHQKVIDAAIAAAKADCACDGTEAKQKAKVEAIQAGIAAVIALIASNNTLWLMTAGCDPNGKPREVVQAAMYYLGLFWLQNHAGPKVDEAAAALARVKRDCRNKEYADKLVAYWYWHFFKEGNLALIYSYIPQ